MLGDKASLTLPPPTHSLDKQLAWYAPLRVYDCPAPGAVVHDHKIDTRPQCPPLPTSQTRAPSGTPPPVSTTSTAAPTVATIVVASASPHLLGPSHPFLRGGIRYTIRLPIVRCRATTRHAITVILMPFLLIRPAFALLAVSPSKRRLHATMPSGFPVLPLRLRVCLRRVSAHRRTDVGR